MVIKSIQWQEALPIRHQVLWPDKTPSFCQVQGDETAAHYGAYCDDELVSVASVYIDDNRARLRKFATLSEYQGQGIGSRVITHLLTELKAANIEYFWCDARRSAVGFYQKFGLEAQGDEFFKSGIPYFKMEVRVSDLV